MSTSTSNGTHKIDPAIVRDAITATAADHVLSTAAERLGAAAMALPDTPVVSLGQGDSQINLVDAGNGELTQGESVEDVMCRVRLLEKPPNLDDLLFLMNRIKPGEEIGCFFGQSVALALAMLNDDGVYDVAFTEIRGTTRTPFVGISRKKTRPVADGDKHCVQHATYGMRIVIGVDCDGLGAENAWHGAKKAVKKALDTAGIAGEVEELISIVLND